MKTCTRCLEEKSEEEFNRNANYKGGRTSWCKTCQMAFHKVWRLTPSGKASTHRTMLKAYGLTVEQFDVLIIEQTGRCQTCLRPFSTNPDDEICIDHDHVTKKFRGLLCRLCNAALGYARDSPETLMRLATYLLQQRLK